MRDIFRIAEHIESAKQIILAKLKGHTVFELQGNDRAMYTKPEDRWANTEVIVGKLHCNTLTTGSDLVRRIRNRIRIRLEENHPNEIFRVRLYSDTHPLYWYSTESVDTIVDKLCIFDPSVDLICDSDDISSPRITRFNHQFTDTGLPIQVIIGTSRICVFGTHQFIDGVAFSELLPCYIFDSPEQPIPQLVPPIHYIPLVTELLAVCPATQSIVRALRLARNLSYDNHWSDLHGIHMREQVPIDTMKRMKRYCMSRCGGKFGFSGVTATLSAVQVLSACTKPAINIGIVGAFTDLDRTRFNRFTATIIRIVRPETTDPLDILNSVIQQIDRGMRDGAAGQMVAGYVATNVYCADIYFNDSVDCLVSTAPPFGDAVIDGFPAELTACGLVGTTTPIYCGWWSYGNNIMSTKQFRTNDISDQSMVGILDILKLVPDDI